MARDLPVTRTLAPGVRLLWRREPRFATTHVRVVVHRAVDDAPAATAVLARVLESATRSWPTREVLAHRLAELYDAALDARVEAFGGRGALVASLEWPTAAVPHVEGAFRSGLALLGEVLHAPVRDAQGHLDAHIVDLARREQDRELAAQADNKARHAVRRTLELACRGEPAAVPREGRRADLAALGPAAVGALHARLLTQHAMDIHVVGDVPLREVERGVRSHLLGPAGTAPRRRRGRPGARVRAASPRLRRVLDRDEVGQAQWVMAWRGAIGPRTRAAAAGEALSGVLGESGASLLFQVVRETHGLSYALGSLWRRDAGLLLVHAGIEEADARRVGLHVRRLVADLATKPVEAARLAAWKAEVHDRFAGLADLPSALSRWWGVAEAWGDAPDPRAASERLLAVTPAAIRAVARRLGPEVVYRLRPAGGDA